MSALANQIHDLNLGWLEAGCVILQILGALAEPDDGKVQCPQASRPYQLWRWPTDSLSLLREWEGSVQTENAGVLCVRWLFGSYLFIYLFIFLVFTGKTDWHECCIKPAQAVWADAFLCFFLFIFQQINA